MPATAQRICSLLPSATEIVATLGMADRLVGVSAECDWPDEVRQLPVVSASRVDTGTLSSREVDAAVRAAVDTGRSLYAVDQELIEQLNPDLVLTQDLCTVCAVSSQELAAVCSVAAETISVDAGTIAGIEASVRALADRLGVPARGEAVAVAMRARIDGVREIVREAPPRTVFVCEWLDPPFVAGHWVPEMVTYAGGQPILGAPGAPSYPTTWATIQERAPDLVVLAPCGFDAERTAREARPPPLGCRVVAVDANAYFSRPAPRVADGIAQLAFLTHPEVAPDPGLPYIDLVDNNPLE